jgi:hypothetical protein
MKKLPTRLKLIPFILLVAVIAALAGFSVWAYTPPAPMPEALAALQSDQSVAVRQSQWITFMPAQSQPTAGLIFYPGGRVDARSYSPTLRRIAEQGYLVVVPIMPFNLAVFSPNAAAQIMAQYPTVHTWAVGGHSLGGAMAADFAYHNQFQVKGLILWASYPPEGDSFTNSVIKVLSISADHDGLATPAKIDHSRALLPSTTTWVVIAGGDHAQFGWYGSQSGDQPARISRIDQQEQVYLATLSFLQSLSQP